MSHIRESESGVVMAGSLVLQSDIQGETTGPLRSSQVVPVRHHAATQPATLESWQDRVVVQMMVFTDPSGVRGPDQALVIQFQTPELLVAMEAWVLHQPREKGFSAVSEIDAATQLGQRDGLAEDGEHLVQFTSLD